VSTLTQMVDQVLADMNAYVRTQDSLTTLVNSMDAVTLSTTVVDPAAVAKGLIEIDEELLYVNRVNQTTAVVDIIPGGRGWQNSTAATHAGSAIVRNNPLFPRVAVKRALNDTITTLNLYAVKKYDFMFDGTTLIYELPTDCVDVTSVSYQSQDSTGRWPSIMNWRPDQNFWPEGATSARFGIELLAVPPAGRTVRVQYLAQGTAITSGQDFTLSGLPSTAEDLVRLGAMWRLMTTVDPGRLLATSPTADSQDQPAAVGRASDVSKYIYQLFQARLAEEKQRQTDQLVTIIHYQ